MRLNAVRTRESSARFCGQSLGAPTRGKEQRHGQHDEQGQKQQLFEVPLQPNLSG